MTSVKGILKYQHREMQASGPGISILFRAVLRVQRGYVIRPSDHARYRILRISCRKRKLRRRNPMICRRAYVTPKVQVVHRGSVA
jgi:hypothetical protein